MKKFHLSALFCLFLTLCVTAQKKVSVLQVPALSEYCQINTGGRSVLPSGRTVTPAGQTIRITHDPFGLSISPDGKKAITLHNGVFTVIDLAGMTATRVPGYNQKLGSPLAHQPLTNSPFADTAAVKTEIASPFSNGSFLGVAFGANNKTVYLSGGDNGSVIVYDIENLKTIDSISLNGTVNGETFDHSFTSDLLLRNNELLVLDRANFRMVRIDLTTKSVTASIKTGRQPFAIALSPDKSLAFVANVGLYEYPLITGITKSNYDSMLISAHPYGNNTRESIEGTEIEGKKIPGVGSPLVPEAMSVYTINLATNTVMDRYKTGLQIGQMIEDAEVVGGSSPNAVVVGRQFAYISNATNDNIAVIDYVKRKIVAHIPITVDKQLDNYRGLMPFGLALSRDEKTLYAALLGFNAVAVIDLTTKTTRGLIPAGWGTSKLALSKNDAELYVISCRGYGAGPNGGQGFTAPPQGTYIGDIQLASFQKIQVPDAAALAQYTRQTLANTFVRSTITDDQNNPLPPLPGLRQSPIKYIVYITKENRTYDEVFGQLSGAKGDATLARFGVDVNVYGKTDSVMNANISPNHHKAARQFSFSDNFYCDSDASIHGHHWMVGVVPNEWVEANSSVDKTANYFSKAPGRIFPGSTGSIDPEDYNETGGLWEALERKKVSFFNFGEANETAHVREEWQDTATGAAHGVMVPMQKALFNRTSHNYAGFNTNIPDQFRMQQFESEFTRKWLTGRERLPQLITMQVPNDHGAGIRPADGYHFPHAFMADNDLAVGRILHFLSRTPYWKNMLVIVTEDDPQGGVDHIDAHRSILMMAGPYVKRGYVSHTHANFGSVLKTIYNILNVPYVNQYDVTASLLTDFFTGKPDFTPYTFVYPSKSVFDWDKAMEKYKRPIDWKKIEQGPKMDDELEQRKGHYKSAAETDKPR